MSDEAAKLLAEAMNRLAAAIERAVGMGSMTGGIHIYHHGCPAPGSPPRYPSWPQTNWSGGANGGYSSRDA